MGAPLDDLAAGYEVQYGEGVRSASRLRELYRRYAHRAEASLVDTVAATAAVNALFLSDQIDVGAVTSQMQEAWRLAFPSADMVERLEALNGLDVGHPEVAGVLGNWKGKLFEVMVRDRLNDGSQIGGITLGEGQRAALAEAQNQPGWDIEILNQDGSVDEVLQTKATASIGYAKAALERYPDINVITTDEVGAASLGDALHESGITNAELGEDLFEPMEAIFDSPIEQLAETVLPGLPFVLIATMEGAKVLMGRQTFHEARARGLERGAKTGVAMGAGALVALAGPNVLALPAVVLTRLGISRYQVQRGMMRKLRGDRTRLAGLVDANQAP